MIKNIVFDMGKVLLDYDSLKVCRHYLSDEAQIQKLDDALFHAPEWILLDRGTITEEEAMVIVKERLEDPELKKIAQECMDHWHEYNVWTKPGMDRVVAYLLEKDMQLYLLSNASLRLRTYQHLIPEISRFSGTIVSAEEKTIKPEKEIYQRLFEKYQIKPQESFFIDDLEENIQGAKRCGMNGYCFEDGNIERLMECFKKIVAERDREQL